MKFLSKLFVLSILVMSISCTIKNEYTFNRDFSGDFKMSIDYSAMKEIMKDDTLKENPFSDIKTDSIPGLDNIQLFSEESVMGIKFSFSDLETLNDFLKKSGTTEKSDFMGFKQKGKKLIYEHSSNNDKLKESANELDKMDEINKMIQIQTIVNFKEHTVKKVNNKNVDVSDDLKTLTYTYSLEDLMGDEKVGNFTVKLK